MTHANVSQPPRFRSGDRYLIPSISVVVAAIVIGGRALAARILAIESLSVDLKNGIWLGLSSLGIVIVLAVLQSRTIGSRAYVVVSTLLVIFSGSVVAIIDAPDRGPAVWIKAGLSALAAIIASIWMNAKRASVK